jgi:hypothetical protein
MPNRHAIGKSVISLRLPTQEDSFQRQQELSRLFWDDAVQAMDEVFNKIAAPEDLLRIERLEVELHFSRWEDIRQAFAAAVSAALEEKLRNLTLQTGYVVELLPVREVWFEAWLQFLETGAFPTQAAQPPEQEWSKAVLDVLGTRSAAVDQLSRLLKWNLLAFGRLVQQHPPGFLKTLVELYTGKKQKELPDLVKELKSLAARLLPWQKQQASAALAPEFLQYPERFFWRQVLEIVIVRRQKLNWQALAEAVVPQFFKPILPQQEAVVLLKKVTQQTPGAFPVWEKWLKTAGKKFDWKTGKGNTSPEAPVFEKNLPEEARPQAKPAGESLATTPRTPGEEGTGAVLPKEKKTADNTGSRESTGEEFPGSARTPGASQNTETPETTRGTDISRDYGLDKTEDSLPETEEPKLRRQPSKKVPPQKEGSVHYVRNAGTVLLHAFLPQFFKTLELLDGKNFRDEWSQHKAVHLLQYLAARETGLPEYELLLPKLLCGVPFAIPIERDIVLEPNETDEAENLLESVIRHWNALGATKPDG